MFIQLVIGTLLIGGTVVLHALALDFIIKHVRRIEGVALKMEHRSWKPFALAAIVLAVFIAHVVEIWIWAAVYFFVHAVPDFETALYFSTTAFTTVGFGNVMPVQEWQLLGAIEGAGGFMLFGWSTAFTFEALSHLYRREGETISR
jgi:hypothetical protein